MAANLPDLDPAERLKHRDDLSHFHALSDCKHLARLLQASLIRISVGSLGEIGDWAILLTSKFGKTPMTVR